MINILVTGANGQIGSELEVLSRLERDKKFYFTDRDNLNITDRKSIERYLDSRDIDIIINCAAYTHVDRAESESKLVDDINHLAVKSLAQIAKDRDIQLIHISTDYIFDGTKHQPYLEDDKPNPQGVYSNSKYLGEEAIKEINPPSSIIIRTSWVYSRYGDNFVKSMINLAKSRSSIGVVYDQIGTPTNGYDLAKVILHIIDYQLSNPQSKKKSLEIYHYSNEGACSWYDYANSIFELSNTKCIVNPIKTKDYPTPAKRPLYSILSKDKIKKDFDITIPYWRDSLKRYFDNIDRLPRISVIGSGFIATGLVNLLKNHPDYKLSKVLTRTDISKRDDFSAKDILTNSIDELIESSDLIVECSGDAIYATDSIDKILKASIPVVTMNSEFHITTGSYFVDKGLVTEAEGDQPGVLAILHEEAVAMGFTPLVYANIKGFLNENPSKEDMEYWGGRSNLSLDMVTSFTDGTKVQIEQVLIANGFGTGLIQEGLVKLQNDDMLEGGSILANRAKELGYPVSDYLLSPKLPAGVFLVVEHKEEQRGSLQYYKMGEGPYYVLDRTYHLCHLEIIKTIKRVLDGGGVLLDNSANPRFSVATIAKRDIKKGEEIKKGIGSFAVRGSSVEIANHPTHVPIGLISNVTFKRDIKEGNIINFDDIEMPDSLALKIWNKIVEG